MKNLKLQLAIWLGLLALCLAPAAASAAVQFKSGIIGQVNEPGLVWTVVVRSSSGDEIADLPTDKSGFFHVDLPPGNYLLTPIGTPPPPSPGHPMPLFIIEGATTTVTVAKNRYTHVVLPIALNPSASE